MKIIRHIGEFFARTDLLCYTLLWLIYLVIAGTLAQRSIGLYMAQQTYFTSFFFWLGPLPLPGGYPTLALLSLGLIANLWLRTEWSWVKSGIIITHFGALLLLVGSLLTAVSSREGSMVIPEGESSSIVADYHERELAIAEVVADAQGDAGSPQGLLRFATDELRTGAVLSAPTLPFTMEVLEYFPNCDMIKRPTMATDHYRGFARVFELVGRPWISEESKNLSGLVFRVEGAGSEADGHYAVFESMQIEQTIKVNEKTYTIDMRHVITDLPFAIHLIDFVKDMHPGTQMARSYQSTVILRDGALEQRSIIHMNHPLRHKGYTFYQASFMEDGEHDTTVLAVVRNTGRLFPYISSLVMCIGLLIHLVFQIPRLIQRRKDTCHTPHALSA